MYIIAVVYCKARRIDFPQKCLLDNQLHCTEMLQTQGYRNTEPADMWSSKENE